MRTLRAVLIVLLFLLFIPRVVYANKDKAYACFYEQEVGEDYENDEVRVKIDFEGNFTTEEKVESLFQALFENSEEKISYVPEGTEVIWANFDDGRLILNLSKEALDSAGNYKERYFVNQIVKTAYSLDEISSIMLYVEGRESNLPEGIDFKTFDR